MKNQTYHVRRHVGLALALIGLMIASNLMLGSVRLASAQAVAPSWSYTGKLNAPRDGQTATLLPNGKVLVAAGGYFDWDNSAELYDPATGVWTFTGSLNFWRISQLTAILLTNGKVLLDGTSGFDARPELYDPATGAWSITSNPNTKRRFGYTATLLQNGKVLFAGGIDDIVSYITISAELYDPVSETWSRTADLNPAREYHSATLLHNGKLLVAGGSDGNGNALATAQIYDPANATWGVTGSLNTARGGHTATLLTNGKVLVAGGSNGALTSAELYDPVTGTWSNTASLNQGRDGHTATLLPNGKVLVVGGDDTAEIYDPGTSSSNQIDDTQFFVRQHYRDFLNREPDPDGLNFWTNEIYVCGSDLQCIEVKRINDSVSFFLSIEFQETGYLVYRFYKAAYGNLPNTLVPIRLNEFLPDTQEIGNGVIVLQTGWDQKLENNKQAFASDFVQRARFISAYPISLSPDAFVDTLFGNAGVTPTSAERTGAINEFGGASTTANVAARARALRRVAENSTLAQQEFNRAFVLMQYFGYLRRNPNDAPDGNFDGYNFWLNKLNSFNGNFIDAEMVKAFLSSIEYRQRFGP